MLRIFIDCEQGDGIGDSVECQWKTNKYLWQELRTNASNALNKTLVVSFKSRELYLLIHCKTNEFDWKEAELYLI